MQEKGTQGPPHLNRKSTTADRPGLRAEAEARFARASPTDRPDLPAGKLLHELQVHQIELEMQNEELRLAQVAVAESRDRYLDLYDFAPVGYLSIAASGRIEEANLTSAALLGVDRGRLPGTRFAAAIVPESLAAWGRLLTDLQKGGERDTCDLVLRRGDGSTFDGHVSCRMRESAGLDRSIRVVLSDVTTGKRAEAALRSSEEHFRLLVASLPIPVAFNDPAGRITLLNERFTQELGYGLEDLPDLAAWFRQAYPDETYRAAVVEAWGAATRKAAREGGDVAPMAFRVTTKRGDVRSMMISGSRVGENLLIALLDVTERERAEERLRESEGRFRALADDTAVGIFQSGRDGRILYVNPTYLALSGLSREQAYGQTGTSAIHPADRERVTGEWREAVAAGTPFTSEYRHQRPDGTVNLVRTLGRPYRDGAGEVGGYVGAIVDITEARALHVQLALASRLAAMGTLVAGVAHEINNPLAATLADLELAQGIVTVLRDRLAGSEPLDRAAEARRLGDAVEELADAQEGGRRISRIVKDLKTFGRPDLARIRIRLSDVVAQAMQWLPATVGHAASVEVQDGGAPDVLASFGQIEQVVVNLIVNAAKAGRPGRPGRILVRIGPGSREMARLDVIDEGTGIAPEVLDRIFEPFFTTSETGGGTGLGLSVSHAIVTGHGGTLTVESAPGKGSTFRVELPPAQNPSVS